jgi:hypothetical protein
MSFSRTRCISLVTTVLAAAPLATAVAGTYLTDVDSTTTYLNHAQLRDWLADGERGLWIQAIDLRWFYARFARACHGLGATNSLLFDTRGSDTIDSRSTVVVPGSGRCTVLTFLPSQGPPQSRNLGVVMQPQAQ